MMQPLIVKYVQPYLSGIQSHNFTRHGLGYVLKGKKYIYDGDIRTEVKAGEIFYLASGVHYTEEIPDKGKPFEQILFFCTSELFEKVFSYLSLNYHINVENEHECDKCANKNHVSIAGWNTLKNFFQTIDLYIRDGVFVNDNALEMLKVTELLYLIVTHNNNCLRSKVLENFDISKENFEHIIRRHVFIDISSQELADKCKLSLSTFKKKFKSLYHASPHKWFTKQRLIHSRLLLISTSKSVSEIGIECHFPNTSHYIKLFKKEYGVTPSVYRNRYSASSGSGSKEIDDLSIVDEEIFS